MNADQTAGQLLVCPTPIGNLSDITLRVLQTLAEADVLACEDTRHSRILLDRHGIKASELLSYHEHNERERTPELISRMQAGQRVALISDAGMPLISDPGAVLIKACIQAGIDVQVLPGPSSILNAVVASGLPLESFTFVGFLPRKRTELKRLITQNEQTLIALQSPKRLVGTLQLLALSDPDRPCVVARELTKLHEEVRRATSSELAVYYSEHPPRGEIVLLIGRAAEGQANKEDALAVARELVKAGAKARPAVAAVAKLTGVSANALYDELLEG